LFAGVILGHDGGAGSSAGTVKIGFHTQTRRSTRETVISLDNASEKEGLHHGTDKGNHSQAAVNDFLFLTVCDLFGSHLAEQTSVQTEVTGFTLTVVHVESGSFGNSNCHENLDIGTKANRGNSTKDIRVGEGFTGEVNTGLLGDDSANGEHAHAAMLQFSPASVFQISLDIGTAEWSEKEERSQEK
jgi:hypothetical protein